MGDSKSTDAKLGGRIEVWQKNITSPDNLITLNEGVEKKLPYAGIEVKRGSEDSPAYLLWTEDEERWNVVKDGERKTIAFEEDLPSTTTTSMTTAEVPESGGNKYFTKTRVADAILEGKGIEVNRSKQGAKISQKSHTSTHNFWVSNNVVPTKGTDREILPAFVSVGKHEKKKAKIARCRLSSGKAEVFFTKNGKKVGRSMVAGMDTTKIAVNEPLKDGDLIGIAIGGVENGRNLSVSITVETTFS